MEANVLNGELLLAGSHATGQRREMSLKNEEQLMKIIDDAAGGRERGRWQTRRRGRRTH